MLLTAAATIPAWLPANDDDPNVLDNFGRHSSEEILPEYQALEPGDLIPLPRRSCSQSLSPVGLVTLLATFASVCLFAPYGTADSRHWGPSALASVQTRV